MEIEDRDLVGVEYPGCVKNVDNMIKTLGGLTNLSKVVGIEKSKRMKQKKINNLKKMKFTIDI